MRLCQIVPSLEEQHGGPSRSVYELSGALARLGHTVNLLATGPAAVPARTEGRLSVEIFRRDWPQAFCPSGGLRRRLRRLKADLVHHHALWLRPLDYARQFSRRQGVKLVISPRGMMGAWAWRHHRRRKRLARWLVHPGALEAAAGWHATSEEEKAAIRACGFGQPICVAPNGVQAPSAEEMAAAELHWREACPESNQQPVALFYSRFHRKKRVLDLIETWADHGSRDWLLLLVGIPQDYSPEMLEDYARDRGARGVRVFTGLGRPPPYAVASLFLLPSHNENFGLVVAEALAHGVPALVTDTTPWAALNDNGAGWCVPWESYPSAMRAALAEGSSRLRQRGADGRAWVLDEFSWDRPARLLAEFYEGLGG